MQRILYITQELTPYLPESSMSATCRVLAPGAQESGNDVRIFMPRYGCIRERNNQLHEVIRLSGMHLTIDDIDYPIIIKVAPLPGAKVQVYFIEGEEFTANRAPYCFEDGSNYTTHDHRSVFFVRGALETIKKLRWTPDIVHCHGWLSALATVYLRDEYIGTSNYPESKIVYSLYNDPLNIDLGNELTKKTITESVSEESLKTIRESQTTQSVQKLAIDKSDALIIGEEAIDPVLMSYAEASGKPIFAYKSQTDSDYMQAINQFYSTL